MSLPTLVNLNWQVTVPVSNHRHVAVGAGCGAAEELARRGRGQGEEAECGQRGAQVNGSLQVHGNVPFWLAMARV
jgi:hypothetical protein